jgi:ketosteroid isomerase-like protein
MELLSSSHPAQFASIQSMKNVRAKNRAAWLALFAEDAVVEDPVGKSPLDPGGNGHRGHEAIGRFWDMVIAPGEVEMRVRESYPSGSECANVVTIINRMPGRAEISVDTVIVYRVDERGKLVSLRAYWDFAKVAGELEAALHPG